MSVQDLEEPVAFWLREAEEVGYAALQDGTKEEFKRSCVFWEETAGRWAGEGCVADAALSNFSHVRCLCTHLTSFSSAFDKALCKLCNVEVAMFLDDPSEWMSFDWGSGKWGIENGV